MLSPLSLLYIASLKTYMEDKGFTLIEILVVIAILTLVLSLSMILSLDDYRGYTFRDERDKVISILEKARSQAINNICVDPSCDDGASHGVHIINNTFTEYEGEDWGTRHTAIDEVTEIGPSINVSGISDVIFSQLSGDATTTPKTISNITLSDVSGHNSVITINTEGNISWTN